MPPTCVGHYVIEHELGHGQESTVYLGRDLRLDRPVAIKILDPNAPGGWPDLLREARLASSLDHRYIGSVLDVGEEEGTAFIAMEYVDGPSVAERLQGGSLGVSTALRIGLQVCEAMAYAHSKGVLHGDIKASNVLLNVDGEAKLVDFGSGARSRNQGVAIPLGDLWAFGILLYQMVTGEDPPSHALDGPPPRPVRLRAVPARFAAIIERCMDTDTDRCYRCAADVLRDLRSLSDDSGTAAAPKPRLLEPWKAGLLVFCVIAFAAMVILDIRSVHRVEIVGPPAPSPAQPVTRPPPPQQPAPQQPLAQRVSPATTAGGTNSKVGEKSPGEARVWVNLPTRKYHCSDSPWYGHTKLGEYLTQKQAEEKGYSPARGRACK
jgi:predicted Ser/Thr protein kinase